MATQHDPMILVYAPAGIVVLGAAVGMARALEEGLHQRLLRWLTGVEMEAVDVEPGGTATDESAPPTT